jgi:hypothetical protein
MTSWRDYLSLKNFYLIIIVILYFFALRAGSLEIPFLSHTPTYLSDGLWKRIFPDQLKFGGFSERYGSPNEGLIRRAKNVRAELISGKWGILSTPFLGEPIKISSMVRKKPEITSISLSKKISDDILLFQRIHEGVYPVKVVPQGQSKFRLVAHTEITTDPSCEFLDKSKEAVLVLCR